MKKFFSFSSSTSAKGSTKSAASTTSSQNQSVHDSKTPSLAPISIAPSLDIDVGPSLDFRVPHTTNSTTATARHKIHEEFMGDVLNQFDALHSLETPTRAPTHPPETSRAANKAEPYSSTEPIWNLSQLAESLNTSSIKSNTTTNSSYTATASSSNVVHPKVQKSVAHAAIATSFSSSSTAYRPTFHPAKKPAPSSKTRATIHPGSCAQLPSDSESNNDSSDDEYLQDNYPHNHIDQFSRYLQPSASAQKTNVPSKNMMKWMNQIPSAQQHPQPKLSQRSQHQYSSQSPQSYPRSSPNMQPGQFKLNMPYAQSNHSLKAPFFPLHPSMRDDDDEIVGAKFAHPSSYHKNTPIQFPLPGHVSPLSYSVPKPQHQLSTYGYNPLMNQAQPIHHTDGFQNPTAIRPHDYHQNVLLQHAAYAHPNAAASDYAQVARVAESVQSEGSDKERVKRSKKAKSEKRSKSKHRKPRSTAVVA